MSEEEQHHEGVKYLDVLTRTGKKTGVCKSRKGQAMQFNWLFEKGAFIMQPDGTFYVDFAKAEDAVEGLSREIPSRRKGNKPAAKSLLDKYCLIPDPLKGALQKLESIQVPVDITPAFPIVDMVSESE